MEKSPCCEWVNQLFRLGRLKNSELFVYQRVNDVNYGRFTGAKRREWRNGMIIIFIMDHYPIPYNQYVNIGKNGKS